MPRLDYSGGATCPSLLLEPSRSNLLSQSEYLNASIIARSNDFIINTSDTTSPEGLNNACKFEFIPGGARYFGRNVGTLNDATTSVFVKAGSHQYIQYVTSTNSTFAVNFDVANGTSNVVGTLPSGATYDIEDYGNGWYRIWVSHDHLGTAPSVYWWVANDLNTPRAQAATSAGDMYFYGFQIEAGSYPTSYIPTYGSSQTRAAEGQTYTGFSSLIGQTEGTLFLEIEGHSPNGTEIFSLNRTTTNAIFLDANNDIYRVIIWADGVSSTTFTSIANTDKIKIAVAYQSNNFAVYANGSQILTNNTWTWTPNILIDTLNFNVGGYVNSKKSSKFNQLVLFKERLSDAELQALTTV